MKPDIHPETTLRNITGRLQTAGASKNLFSNG